ncbi:hypothetical protein Y032_0012g1727 [Ancylostoma ceylanicum]|uniref:Uncharacterized protein n=1 Tax=Ancylostoma ceylanicum TaxID=53326 RepID=A0A016VDQ7_9BILA|nr:hypothetical protein Y032_0012g1727 [Ancylostoma ceylanicum]
MFCLLVEKLLELKFGENCALPVADYNLYQQRLNDQQLFQQQHIMEQKRERLVRIREDPRLRTSHNNSK